MPCPVLLRSGLLPFASLGSGPLPAACLRSAAAGWWRLWLTLVATVVGVGLASPAAAQPPRFVEATHDGQTVSGLQLIRQPNLYLLLGVDGQLHQWPSPPAAEDVRLINGRFEPESVVQMRSKLTREFGGSMEVVTSKHYLVVQPAGRGKHWPELFERFHREFLQQMLRRDVDVRRGRFPMVAVVFPDRAAFQREMSRQGQSGANLAGVYINSSNRVYTYDGGYNEQTAEVLRHEAAHQSAFNCNVHSRLTDTPMWITEGLGMMFEPAAMTRSDTVAGAAPASSRLHRLALQRLNQRYADRTQSLAYDIGRLVRDDHLFDDDGDTVLDAYSIAWLMMFYLAERRPAAFAELLNHTTNRPPLQVYSSAERVEDFERIVGRSIADTVLEIRAFLRYLDKR